MAATAGYKAGISIAADAAGTTFSQEATTANTARTMYQITSTTKRYWSPATALVIETSPDNSNWTAITSGFQVAYAGGVIVFPSAQAVGTYVRVSGKYLAISALGGSKEWTYSGTMDTIDTTEYTAQSGGGTPSKAKRHIPTLPSATVSLSRWWMDDYFLPTIADPKAYFIVTLYVVYSTMEANAKRIECLCVPTSRAVKCMLAGAIEESLAFVVTGIENTLQLV